jgi:hypothetical protein
MNVIGNATIPVGGGLWMLLPGIPGGPVGGELQFTVPNVDQPNIPKQLWLQVTFSTIGNPPAPDLDVFALLGPGGGPAFTEVVNQRSFAASGPNRINLKTLWTFDSCPPEELITIAAPNVPIAIEQVVIDTQCVPEPQSWLLFGLGSVILGLLLRVRRVRSLHSTTKI